MSTYKPRVQAGVSKGGEFDFRRRGESGVSLSHPGGRVPSAADPKAHTSGQLRSIMAVLAQLEAKFKNQGRRDEATRERITFTEHDRQSLLNARRLHRLLQETVDNVSSDAEAVRFLAWKHDELALKSLADPARKSIWPWVRRSAERRTREDQAVAKSAQSYAAGISLAMAGGQRPQPLGPSAPAAAATPRQRSDSQLAAVDAQLSGMHRLDPMFTRVDRAAKMLRYAVEGAASDIEVVSRLQAVHSDAKDRFEIWREKAAKASQEQNHQEFARHAAEAQKWFESCEDAVEFARRVKPLPNAAHRGA